MDESMIGFIIWALCGCLMIGIGISAFFSKKAVGFWSNIKVYSVNNIKGYNHAVGRLFILYGIIFIVLGLPLLSENNTSYVFLSVLGVMIETIAIMVIYSLHITKKYQEK